MANTIDQLNFEVILDDKEFNSKIKTDIQLAEKLNIQLSTLLKAKVNMTKISAEDAASAKRQSDILAKQAIDQERIKQAAAKTAKAEEEVRTQAARTAKELAKASKAAGDAALQQQRVATEAQRTAKNTNDAAVSAQRLRTETQRTATEVQRTATATQNTANATARAQLAQKRLADYSRSATNQIKMQSKLLSDLKGYALGYLSIRGASQLLSSLVRVTGEFELQKTTLAAMLGDLSKAEKVISRIQALAIESPFQFKELTTYAKQLSAFSVPAEELYETTKMLADISAGLGVGMDRIVLAYGQVKSAAFLRGQEVRQFTEAGIPILDELAKQFEQLEGRAVSTGEVFDKISARLVPFEMVSKVLKDLTSEGGKFFNMQEVQAETLRGKISNLKDAYEVMLNEMGSQKSGAMKGAVDSLKELMQNWQKVGAILATVIVSYGVYQTTLAGAWAIEKLMAAGKIVEKYHKLNAAMLAAGKNVNKLKNAFIAMGSASKVAIGGLLAAIGAVVTIITIAVKNANALKKELDSIMSSEVSGSKKMTDDLDRLVMKLKEAKEGSKNYRDAISEINRKYGDYLPNLIKEADSYDKVKNAADAAAEAIRNKAKASAFDKGSAAIENKYGESLTNLAKGLENTLLFVDPTIPRKAALEFVKKFKDTITTSGQNEGFYDAFSKVYKEFFGKDDLSNLLNAANGKIRGYSDRVVSLVESYGHMVAKMGSEQKKLDEELELRFGEAQYDSFEEMRRMMEIDQWYRNELELKDDALNKLVMTQEEYNKAVEKLNIEKLRKQIHVYDLLKRTDIAKNLRKQLDALTKVPEGWRGTVQGVLKGMGLNKGTSFGLWAEDTTQSTSYVEDMIKRYKELKDEIKWVSTFDQDQTDRLKKNKEAIEAVAKALKIDIKDLAASKGDKKESKEERRIKRLIEALRKLQDQYDKLKAYGASDDSIKKLFKGLYPDLIAENGDAFVTDLKYLERAIGLVEQLEKLAPNDAKKLLVDLGADEFSQYLDKIKEQDKAYKESAKAAGEYFNLLRKWTSEDFNLNGEGITLDVSKITSDLNSKINEIELRVTKAKEVFGNIDVDSEEEILKVKELFVKEFGADAWDDFWNNYYTEGANAIDRLYKKEVEYEKKLAQEKINDLAHKYVKESYFEDNIEISDLGDKSFFQLRDLRKKLQDLLNKEPLQVPIELKEQLSYEGIDIKNLIGVDLMSYFETLDELDMPISLANQELLLLIQNIQKAGLSTEDLGKTIKKVIGGDLKNLTQEEGEAFMSMVESYMGEINKLMSSISKYAETLGDDDLQGAVNGISEAMDILGSMADKLAKGDWVGAVISGITSLTSVILEAVSKQNELNAAIAQTRNEMALLASQKRIESGVESIFGTDDFKKFQNAYDELLTAHAKANADLQKQNEKFWGGSSDDWGIGGVLGAAGAGAALGAAVGSIIPGIGTAIGAGVGAGVGALIGAFVGGVGAMATEANNYAVTLDNMAKDIGADLIDAETGVFDVETLKRIRDTYDDLDSEYKAMLDELIVNAEIFENAVTEMATFMTDIFGQCADDMADSFINSFKESGQAALDYGDIMNGLATDIAKSIIKSTILQNVFNEEDAKKAAVQLASGNAAGALSVVDEAMQSAQELAPYIQQLLESLQPYFEMGEMEGESLGDGIKGITEDTANLLASYLNAIRADVSYARTIWERMDITTQQIATMLAGFSAPSLMEYQMQIAANTYNTAMHTQSIMEDLRSVITSDGGFTAIRTYS